jgi:hypothetical protein
MWKMEAQLHAFLTLALDEGEWSVSFSSCQQQMSLYFSKT